MTYQDILDKILDSRDATVGGGSASALSGAMAAGLIGMVSRLSVGKDYGFSPEEYERVATELDGLAAELLKGSVADTEAFRLIKEAYQIPKEEKERRRDAIQSAGMKAADVPLANGALCLRVHELGKRLSGRSNPNAASDIAVGLELSRIGYHGCLANVRANLGLIKDEHIRNGYEQRIASLELERSAAC